MEISGFDMRISIGFISITFSSFSVGGFIPLTRSQSLVEEGSGMEDSLVVGNF